MIHQHTHLNVSLCGFRYTKDINPVNWKHVSACKPTPLNFLPQISITQNGNVGHKYGQTFVEPIIFYGFARYNWEKKLKIIHQILRLKGSSMNTKALKDAC